MLKERVLTAMIGLPLLLYVLISADRWLAALCFSIFVGLSVFEVSGIMLPALERRLNSGDTGHKSYLKWQIFCTIVGLLLFFVSTFGAHDAGRGGIVLGMSVLMLVGVFSSKTIDHSIVRLTGFLVSVCYGCLPWLAAWDLYLMGEQGRYIMLVITVVMLNDTGAYFGGRRFGRRKLAKILSPKKTWEGACCGIVVGICGVFVIDALYGFALGSWLTLVVVAVLAGIAGILGDLVESAFKRFAEVKDSGNIFPGHGGFLDRVDSLLFAAPIAWFILYISATIIS